MSSQLSQSLCVPRRFNHMRVLNLTFLVRNIISHCLYGWGKFPLSIWITMKTNKNNRIEVRLKLKVICPENTFINLSQIVWKIRCSQQIEHTVQLWMNYKWKCYFLIWTSRVHNARLLPSYISILQTLSIVRSVQHAPCEPWNECQSKLLWLWLWSFVIVLSASATVCAMINQYNMTTTCKHNTPKITAILGERFIDSCIDRNIVCKLWCVQEQIKHCEQSWEIGTKKWTHLQSRHFTCPRVDQFSNSSIGSSIDLLSTAVKNAVTDTLEQELCKIYVTSWRKWQTKSDPKHKALVKHRQN